MTTARSFALALVIVAAGVVLAAQGRAQQAVPAGLTKQTWTVDGVERSALVSAPRTPASGAGSALVFVFHGHGGTSAQAARSFGIHQAWPEALVIYPQGLPTVGQVTDPQGNLPGWQHTPGGERNRDLHLVDAMFAWATKTYAVDRTRVFAAGHSNGGSMVYVLWAAQPDRFAAFAPSSSVFKLAQVTAATPKPAFIVAGQKDALVPFATQQISLRAVLRLNRAAADGTDWSGGVKKHASSSGADVFTYIHPGGHPMPADAGAMMVKFFRSVQTSPGTAIDPADVAFGYADSTGSKLMMLPEMDKSLPIPEPRARTMVRAVCSEGRDFPIRYAQFQKGTAADSHRKVSSNFANDEGHVFEIAQGRAAENETCLLVPAGYIQAFPILRNDLKKADRALQSLSTSAKQAVGRIEKEKSRTAKIYWPIHRAGTLQEVAAVEFNAMGDSLLGSLVLVEPGRLSFFDMPASLKKGREDGGCWRVDDDCHFNYEELEIPAVLGEPGRQLVLFTNWGAEGQLIVLFQSRDGKLAELIRNYRYASAF